MHNFGRSVNRVVIPELSEAIVLESVKKAYNNYLSEQNSNLMESLDFYYNQNLDSHIEPWFASDSLSPDTTKGSKGLNTKYCPMLGSFISWETQSRMVMLMK